MAPLPDMSPTLVVTDPPEWVPDEACGFCTACKAPFTVIRRKHHCRSCGKVGGTQRPEVVPTWVLHPGGPPTDTAQDLEVSEAGKAFGVRAQAPSPGLL